MSATHMRRPIFPWRRLAQTCHVAVRILGGAGAVLVLSAGCRVPQPPNGIASHSAAEVLQMATVAVSTADSVHVVGRVPITRSSGVGLDVKVRGADGLATITSDGSPLTVIRLDGSYYIMGNADFWRVNAGETAVRLLEGRYLKAPASHPGFGKFQSYFVPANMLVPKGIPKKGDTRVVNGVKTIAIIDPDPLAGGIIYIATEGPPYPIRLESADGQGRLDFTEYNKSIQIQAPPADQIVEVAALEQPPR